MRHLKSLLLTYLFLICFTSVWSQVSITSTTFTYAQDFNGLANTGSSSIVPTSWALSESGTNANTIYTAGTGTSNMGDSYSFGEELNSDRAFGGLQSGSLIPTIGASFTNNSLTTLTSLRIFYAGEQWRLGTLAREDRLDFQYSTNATSLTTGTWTDFNALDFTAPVTAGTVGSLVGNNAPNRTLISSAITGISLTNGSTIWIRWTDFNASGADDGLGVDDFTLSTTYTSAQNGDWNTASTWVGNSVPVAGSMVFINHNVTIATALTNSGSVTINTGASLAMGNGTYTNSGSTTVNGTFQINNGGFAFGGTWTYGANSTLVYNHTGSTYGPIDSGHHYWPSSNGPANVTIQGANGHINLGVSRTVPGLFQTAAGVTLSSGAVLTLNGLCQLNSGGFFNNPPTYGVSSTLVYNTASTSGSPYGRGNEWSATSGAGYPNNVTLSGNTFVDLGNGGTGTLRQCAGNLTIDAGSGLYMDFGANDMTQPLVVLGNVIQNGSLSLSDASGGDLKIRGNYSRTGTFTPKGRAVFFDAVSGDQTITGATAFDFLILDKSSGNLLLTNDITLIQTLTLSNGLINTAGNKVVITSTGSISRTNGWVNGNLERYIPFGAASRTFEIGDAFNYAPLDIAFSNVSVPGNLLANTINGLSAPTAGTIPAGSGISQIKYLSRSWTTTNFGITFDTYNATFNFVAGDIEGGASTAALIVGKNDSGTWSHPTVGVRTPTSTQVTGVNSFNDFRIGESDCTAPSGLTYTSSSMSTCVNSAIAANNVSAVSGSGPITYSISPALPMGMNIDMNSGTISGTPTVSSVSTAYTVTATNACGNSTAMVTIEVNDLPAATISAGGPLTFCSGGSVQLTASMGSSYLWSPGGETLSAITANTGGSYTVQVTDANGCSANSLATLVTVNTLPTAVISGNLSYCASGSTILTASGGTSFLWDDLSTNAMRSISAAGAYTVQVTDANGCTDTEGVMVSAASTANSGTSGIFESYVVIGAQYYDLQEQTANPDFHGTSLGTFPVGGTLNFSGGEIKTYKNSGDNFCGGKVWFDVYPSFGAPGVFTAIALPFMANLPNPGDQQWGKNNNTDNLLTGLTAGTYNLAVYVDASGNFNGGAVCSCDPYTVDDRQGFYYLANFNVCDPPTGLTYTSPTMTACKNSAIASNTVSTVSGGGVFTYSISPVLPTGLSIDMSTGEISGTPTVASATTNYTITTNNGCGSTTANVAITVNDLPSASIAAGGPITFCNGGSVQLTASVGSTYLWSPGGETSSMISVTNSGNYSVQVTDANGCSATSMPTMVTVYSLPSATISAGGPTTFCMGVSVQLTSSLGSDYLWSPGGETTPAITVNTSGSYTVQVTDGNGCSATSVPTVIVVNPLPVATITAGGPTTFCAGGSVMLTSGMGASYLWSPGGETTASINAMTSGSYTLQVTDANGCTDTESVTTTMNTLPTAVISGDLSICAGSSNTLTASGGDTYLWDDLSTNAMRSVNTASTFTVQVTDANGCTDTESITTTVNPLPVVDAGMYAPVCLDAADILLNGSPLGGNWMGLGLSGNTFDPSAGSQTLTYTYTDGNFCTNSDMVSITVNNLPTALISQSSGCGGGSIDLIASGGTSFLWDDASTNPMRTVTMSGTYFVTVTDGNNCTDTESIIVTTGTSPIEINNGGCFTSIAAALAGAMSGDIIDINMGSYSESFMVPEGVTLRINAGTSVFNLGGTICNNGTIELNGGSFLNAGEYAGKGAFIGTFVNSAGGRVRPGGC